MRDGDSFRAAQAYLDKTQPTVGAFKNARGSPVLRWVETNSKYQYIELLVAMLVAVVLCIVLLFTPENLATELAGEVARVWSTAGALKIFGAVAFFSIVVPALVKSYLEVMRGDKKSKGFLDIDYEGGNVKKLKDQVFALNKLVVELQGSNRELREKVSKTPADNSQESESIGVEETDSLEEIAAGEADNTSVSPVESHIHKAIESLERHIDLSDKKASKLLDTGTMYLRRGIYFYVGSILVWQAVAHVWGVDHALMFGVVSCSLTFLVVEFLAAWFLKQYRNFNDSSMQFMKVKSVYDRYLLSYHTLVQFSAGSEVDKEARSLMLAVLEKEARWPELAGLKSADLNHMAQMFDSVGGMLERAKGIARKEGA
jgi:hypothetical protein